MAHPDRAAYRFLRDGEEESLALTYAELDRAARAVAALLTASGAAGERALLLFPPGLEFVAAFLGCLYAGTIAVPAYPPRANRPDPRLRALIEDARPRFVLTVSALASRAGILAERTPGLAASKWLATDRLDLVAADVFEPAAAAGEGTAFLQYTSGSTSSPKGVMVTHGNLMHNEEMIRRAFGLAEGSVIVGWLPLYHDMGLIGNVLQPLYLGGTSVLMSPAAFLRRPARWLEAISRYRAVASGGPNFAYELAARKAGAERRELDLSSWTIAFNGAEPVRAETLDRFAAAFAECGFRREAFYPCYGLAEATLLVAGGEPSSAPEVFGADARALARHRAERRPGSGAEVRPLVSSGRPWLGQKVVIAEPERKVALPPGRVGEIWVAGSSVAAGYWNRSEETARTFGAHLSGSGEGPFLRTGDLGFVEGGELFVTGRLKDLVILRGRNHYPQDIELSAEASHPALRAGASAAFSAEVDGEERLLVACELERGVEDLEAVAAAVGRAVAEEHELAVHRVFLLAPGKVPKTSSGKVRRGATRDALLSGALEPLADWRPGRTARACEPPRTPAEERLERLWAEVFERDRVGIHESFFELGGDSLRAARLASRILDAFGVELGLDSVFENPTVAEMATLLEEPELAPPGPLLRPAPHDLPVPLSSAQRRLWFLHRLDPENPVHNIGARARLTGRLDVAALAAALDEVLRRHEALRTSFVAADAEPVLEVAPASPLAPPVVDLTALAAAARDAESRRIARALARRPFDLERGALLRAALTRLGRRLHELVLVFHHIAADGGSLAVFLDETAALYETYLARRPAALPELPVRYADYVFWQREWLAGNAAEAALAYWRRQLAGLPTVELPADRPRPAMLSYRGAHLERRLGAELTAALDAFARQRGTTLFLALAAGFLALLHRYTGRRDLVVGTPVSGRTRVELEGLIGLFINNLVLRVRAETGSGYGDLLDRARAAALAAYAHQELPFDKLVDELRPERDLSRAPLFQVMFVGQNAPLEKTALTDLELEPAEIDAGTARFDLAVAVAPATTGWLATWKYSVDLFDATTVARMAGHFANLLRAAAADPGRPLSRLPLASPGESHQLVSGWNDTRRAFGRRGGLHELVEEQAARTPAAVALAFGNRGLTYRELDRRANALALRLRGIGVGPESRVGIAMERSLELVTGLLGILKAGGAYVPLDPDYPRDRLAFMLEDAGVAVLLTQKRLRPLFAAGAANVLELDAEAPAASEAPPAGAGPLHAAYVIYTSGSTGRPKGVVIPHEGIANRLLWMQETYGLTAHDRVLQKTPASFDVSVWEFFWPLVAGARLEVAPPGAHRDARRLAELVRERRVTTLHFVPSMLRLFLEESGLAAACRSVERVIVSGEALPFELKERFFERLETGLHNLYGPTEASVDVTYEPCAAGGRQRTVPIGRPIANTRIRLLSAGPEPVPAAVPGRLFIGGVGLARGYHARPGLTAERFVPDPLGGVAGGRLYDTGDLARFRADGAVEFLGRVDHQVKVRGFRIELGEIEEALARHPAVRECVALARHEGGVSRLAAYVVPAADGAPAAAALRGFLEESLPPYMVPAVFVTLAALPLSPSGKADRSELARRPLPAEVPGSDARSAPETALERRLAGMWRDLLGVAALGVHDNFFELGGDSIQAAMLVNRLQKELGEIVYVMAIFDAPTVAELAAYLEERYSDSVSRLAGGATPAAAIGDGSAPADTEAALAELRAAVAGRLGRAGATARGAGGPRHPPAVFILSPFRSGSTLLRVMLAGHSRLFAPPELELLPFDTLAERRAAYGGRDSFALEGLVRAVMELRGCDASDAREIVDGRAGEGCATGEMYRLLRTWSGDRTLVDKTPSYCLDAATLRRAEALFEAPLYVHLVRDPRAAIHSYVEARMDRVYADYPFAAREQAELVWLLGHRNGLDFLSGVPRERRFRLAFEDLVRSPRSAMEALARFLGVEFEPAMLQPYAGRRMTDGLGGPSRMMGDPKFHQHRSIDAAAADRWRREAGEVGLREETRELARALGYSLPAAGAGRVSGPRPVPRDQQASLPLSFAQERLWFLDRLDPGSPVYNMPAAVRLSGPLDAPALAASFDEVRRRHEVLRTAFPASDGRPLPAVAPPAPAPLPLVDLGALPDGLAGGEGRRLAVREGRRAFDLARGPMLRTVLLRHGERCHVLLATMHHIVSDGWSIGVLVRELGALYRAFARGLPSPLAELPVQYADYAHWQRRWLGEDAMASHLAYWRERLAAPLPVLELPSDRPRPPLLTYRGARLTGTLPGGGARQLETWSRRQGSTLFLTLLAAFNVLLHRHTGQTDVLLGIPVANRGRAEIEGLIGFFLNMVVQRTDLGGAPTFRGLLERVSAGFLESSAHQEAPFEKVVEALQPARDLSRSPFFQIQLSLQNTPAAPLELPGLALELLEIHNRTTKFDVTVFLFSRPEGLVTTLEYNTDLFDRTTLGRLLGHWRTLLAGVVGAADRRLAELPLLTAPERRQMLSEWNVEPAAPSPVSCLHRLFEARADLRPGAVAVVCGVEELSYRELDERANKLANLLRAAGVGPEVLVGLFLERSLDMVAAILGVLKAGGAYVPLDPSYPAERLAFLLEDALAPAATRLVVTRDRLARMLPAAGGEPRYRLVRLDADRDELDRESARRPEAGVSPANLAYVIYTSGSTGRPKGVGITHANVARLLARTEPWFGFGESDVWTLFHSYAFDFSVWEIWGALAYGGSLVVVPRDTARAPERFHKLLTTEGVTVLNQTPSAFRQLVEVDGAGGTRNLALTRVIFGGEALDVGALEPWMARHPFVELVNMYGITETTVHVTYRRLRAADLRRGGASPVGVPIPDLRVHLLGRGFELLPVGAAGEIAVAGEGLARGYLGRPDLAARRFVPDPFAERPGGRLYRSGDLARRRGDGDLEYLGRLDTQVKVRGFRIELGEIEAALGRHPGVREAVVVADRGAGGEARLAAWIVPRGPEVPPGELADHLRRSLPEYMVPAAFGRLDRLPATPSGKVDRAALAHRGGPAASGGPAMAPPRTRTERKLAAAWREVLGVGEVGARDNFFELGGHSLLVTRLVSRLRQVFGVELPMATVFEAPTLARLAELIDARVPEGGGEAGAPAIVPLPRRGDAPLSFAQERLWFLDQLEPGSPMYNVPVALVASGRLSPAAFEATFREIVRRHETLRTSFADAGGRAVQRIARRPSFGVPLVDLAALAPRRRDGELRSLALAEAQRPFDLGRAPLLRVRLVRLGPEAHAVLVNLHHIVADGWSMGVLVHEVAALYRAFAATPPEPSPLPEPPVQYADFADWQRARLAGEVLASELDYWRRELAGAPRALELPADRPRPPVQGFRGRHLPAALPRRLTEELEGLAQRRGATLFMALLAAFQAVLCRYSGQNDFLVGSPVANRNRIETEGLIGFFVNTLVLRARLGGAPGFGELLGRVRETTLGAYAHQDLPFEKLVEELAPERDASRPPLFQVMFILQNAPLETLELPELVLAPLDVESGSAKFDLTLSLGEAEGALAGFLELATDLFDAATGKRLLAHLGTLAAHAANDPERPVAELALLTAAERHHLVLEWNDAGAEIPDELAAGGLLAARSRRSPEAVALERGGARLSFGELDRRAGLLARRLAAAGIAPEDRVAIALDRSFEMVAALAAVLASGGAYVPLDPDHPRRRLAAIVEEARPAVVLTRRRLMPALPEPPAGARVVCLGDGAPEVVEPAFPGVDRVPAARPQSPAYVIFTSGSTGRPKGVSISRRALANFLGSMARRPGLDAGDVLVAVTTLSFDIAALELLLPLMAGARVVLAGREETADGHLLRALLERSQATLMQATPATWRLLLDAGWRGGPGFRALSGGETLPVELAGRLSRRTAALWNLYGPTETTVWSALRRVGARELGRASIDLGRPIDNTRLLVLDRRLAPVPSGVPGELAIGGAGLARAYFVAPARTAERFVPDAAAAPGERLYRTGDLARRRGDGTIEFLGRADHQVKLRGFRIELGEIEAALGRHPAVAQAVAAVRGEGAERRLVAYVVAAGGEEPGGAALRAFLEPLLPDYMVPAAFVSLSALPLTANGKVDRAALPEPEAGGATAARSFRGPRDPTEELVAGAWCELLRRDRVGVDESFFDLGGHSLLATRLVSRLRQLCGVELSVRRLFDGPTVAELAEAVRSARRRAGGVTAPPLRPLPRRGPPPLSFAQERLWFLDQLDPGSSLYNLPAAIRVRGAFDAAVFEASLGEIVRRHESLRTRFSVSDRGPVQMIDPGWRPSLLTVDLSGLPAAEAEAARQAGAETHRPFDLAAGPLLRALLLVCGRGDFVLLLTVHHIVSDAWSTRVFLSEIESLYRAFARGAPSPLAELPVQYADFACWQRGWLAGEVLERELAYWRETVAGRSAPGLPTDRPAPPGAARASRAETLPFALAPATSAALRALSGSTGTSLFMTLLAAFQAFVRRSSGDDDFVLGTPVANRNRAEVEELIGFFVNTLVLTARTGGNPTFRELVARVREATLGAYDHRELPFARLVEELRPERQLSAYPLVTVMFELEDPLRLELDLGGLATELLPRREGDDLRTPFTLAVRLFPSEEGIGGSFGYNTASVDASTASRWLDAFLAVVGEAVEDPERRLGELALAGPGERRQLVADPRPEAAEPTPPEPSAAGSTPPGDTPGAEPRRAALGDRWAGLSAAKRDLFRRRLRGAAGLPGDPSPAAGPEPLAAAVTADELRSYLAGLLPSYMVPAAWKLMDELPLTPGGKVDRAALPEPEPVRERAAAPAAPETPAEELLAGIWARVLGLDTVDVRESFFDLGGHSLLATQVVFEVRRVLGVDVPLRALFETPTVEGLARELRDLGAAPEPEPIVPVAGDRPLRLSFAQERLWFLDRLEGASPAYNIPFACRLAGALDAGALGRALKALAERHEILSTVFATDGDTPVQVIAETAVPALSAIDLARLPEPLREAEAARRVDAEAARPFDLARGPLSRTVWIRLGAAAHVLVVTVHHIVADGVSMGIWARELGELYRCGVEGAAPELPALPVQYADYAAWQRSRLTGETLERQLGYWRDRLAGAPPTLELPLDRPRPRVGTFRGTSTRFAIGPGVLAGLRRRGRQDGATLFMALLAAWTALLARYSGQDDVVVGAPVANRRPEVEGLIGLFINTLALRIDAAGDPSFSELLQRVRRIALAAYEHQDLPFEKLVEELRVERDPGRSPLFQVMFVFLRAPMPALRLPGLDPRPFEVAAPAAKFDLTLRLFEGSEGLAAVLEYSTDLFDRSTLGRLRGHFLHLLGSAAESPGLALSQLPLLPRAELHQLRVEWTGCPRPTSSGSIPEAFERQARRVPEAVAAVAGERRLSHGELARWARRLAGGLRRRGVAPETRVGVGLEISLEMVAAVLAVLEAGASYVPIDPRWPVERQAGLVRDAGLALLLTDRATAAAPGLRGLTEKVPVDVLLVDREDGRGEPRDLLSGPGTARPGRVRPENAAYVLYTSGSTGRPKGVVVEHRQISRYLASVEERVGWRPGSRFAMVQPFTVDSCNTALFPPLTSGGTLYLVPRDLALDPGRFAEYLDRHGIDVLKIAPLHLAALRQSAGPSAGLPRGHLVVGGDASPSEWLAELSRTGPCEVFNHYGPTEATVGATAGRISGRETPGPSWTASIGRSLGHARVHVVDRGLRPRPLGAAGELVIGGDAVARGYLGRPGTTGKAFVPDPFAAAVGSRVYRTGDLVRFFADGRIEFLGRIDSQVKIRGYRVEPGEIEAALMTHGTVGEALVTLQRRPDAESRLVGFVVPRPGGSLDTASLRVYLRERLPEHMVPAVLVALDALPLSAHGKVARGLLPMPEGDGESLPPPAAGPRDLYEVRLSSLFEELLGLAAVRLDQSFFELGGHSLLAVRLVARVEQAFGCKLSLATLFEADTIEELAAVLRRQPREAATGRCLVPMRIGGAGRPLFLVHPVGGNVAGYLELAKRLGAERPVYGLQSSGVLDGDPVRTRVEDMAASYLEEIRRVQPEGPYRLGGWSMGGVVAHEMACQLADRAEEVELLALLDVAPPRPAAAADTAPDEAASLARCAADLAALQGLELPREAAARLGSGADFDAFLEAVRGARLVPPDIESERARRLFEVYRANVRAALVHVPRPFKGRMLFLRARQTALLDPERELTWGWRDLARGGTRAHLVPGGHYALLKPPHAAAWSEPLERALTRLDAAPDEPEPVPALAATAIEV